MDANYRPIEDANSRHQLYRRVEEDIVAGRDQGIRRSDEASGIAERKVVSIVRMTHIAIDGLAELDAHVDRRAGNNDALHYTLRRIQTVAALSIEQVIIQRANGHF